MLERRDAQALARAAGARVGEEWDVSGMVEGYSIDGPQAPSNAHRDRDEKINFRRITSRAP